MLAESIGRQARMGEAALQAVLGRVGFIGELLQRDLIDHQAMAEGLDRLHCRRAVDDVRIPVNPRQFTVDVEAMFRSRGRL